MNPKAVERVIGRNYAWERAAKDKDRDGVNNLIDCAPSNPNKQGIIHDIGKGIRNKYKEIKSDHETSEAERQADKISDRNARSEARQVTRETRAEEMQKQAERIEISRAKIDADKKIKYHRQGGFFGQVQRTIRTISTPSKVVGRKVGPRRSTQRSKGKKKSKKSYPPRTVRKTSSSGRGNIWGGSRI